MGNSFFFFFRDDRIHQRTLNFFLLLDNRFQSFFHLTSKNHVVCYLDRQDREALGLRCRILPTSTAARAKLILVLGPRLIHLRPFFLQLQQALTTVEFCSSDQPPAATVNSQLQPPPPETESLGQCCHLSAVVPQNPLLVFKYQRAARHRLRSTLLCSTTLQPPYPMCVFSFPPTQAALSEPPVLSTVFGISNRNTLRPSRSDIPFCH